MAVLVLLERRDRDENALAGQESVDSIFATKLIPNRFDPSEGNFRVFHLQSFPS